MAKSPVVVSAPGKVLLAGGYLVLDRAHTGLVFGLDARIHVSVQPLSDDAEASAPGTIVVKSPQFRNAVWKYVAEKVRENGGGVRAHPVPE